MVVYLVDKKWIFIYQDWFVEWQGDQKWRQIVRIGQYSNVDLIQLLDEEGSFEWYVCKVMENVFDLKGLGSLEVNLWMQQIGWVKWFIECQGQVVLMNVLFKINWRMVNGLIQDFGKGDKNFDKEYDIVKCFKVLMNNKFGVEDVLVYQQVFVVLVVFLILFWLMIWKLVSEVLIFLCYWNEGKGQFKVIEVMDVVKNQ